MRGGAWLYAWRERSGILVATAFSLAGHLALSYCIPRSEFTWLAVTWLLLFAGYLYLVRHAARLPVAGGLGIALMLRLAYLISIPSLSDDFHRFLWDGHVWRLGINPYSLRPVDLMGQGDSLPPPMPELYAAMNSPHYFTVYPPLLQLVFRLAAELGGASIPASVLVLRCLMLAAETGSLLLLPGLLVQLGRARQEALWYALNPLVIVELTGNLHMEGIMIFFLILSLRLLLCQRLVVAAWAWSAAILVKLLPLMFLIFLPRRLGWRSLLFGIMVMAPAVLMFVPFVHTALAEHWFSSLQLYFRNFEFNGSIYSVLRAMGLLLFGYNIIQVLGPALAGVTAAAIVYGALRESGASLTGLPVLMLGSLTVYFLLSPVVHPWYLSTLVLLGVLSGYRFAMVWSAAVVASYAAYRQEPYREVPALLAAEYLVVGLTLAWELRGPRAKPATDA